MFWVIPSHTTVTWVGAVGGSLAGKKPTHTDGEFQKANGRPERPAFRLPLPASDNEKLALLQSPQHVVELIKAAVANGQNAAALGCADADGKAECIRYAFFQRN
jgi:hypothetical protein